MAVVTSALFSYAESEEQSAFKKASECYARLAPKLAPTNVPFADYYRQPFALNEMGMDICNDYDGKYVRVFGQFTFWFDLENGRTIRIGNTRLLRYATTNEIQRIPQLPVEQAVERAKGYMDILGMFPPKHMSISKVSFSEYPSCWLIVWQPMVNGFPYDTFVDPYIQQFRVIFHEKHGFVSCSKHDVWPLPKETIVKITKEDAILKASKAVPLIQRSPHYLQCRQPGFVPSGVHSAQLLIAAPNWLLDPKRAIWLRDKPPDETRLCWGVTFTSVYTGETKPNEVLIAPTFLVYIDAATGEIVGANFT